MSTKHHLRSLIILIFLTIIGCQTSQPNTTLPTSMPLAQLPVASEATAVAIPSSIPSTNNNDPLPPFNRSLTNRIAYQQAHQRALNWQTDAQLISFLVTWTIGSTFPEIVNATDPNWYLLFYSNSSNQLANVRVDKTGISSFIAEPSTSPVPAAININLWRAEEETIFQEMKNRGVEQFLADYGKSSWQFNLTQSNAQLEWNILGTAHQDNQLFQLNMDATTGRGTFFKIIP